jgi:hypothetical protein
VKAVPIGWREAKAYVEQVHRHHFSPQGWKFGSAAEKDGKIVGVVMVGRPTSRELEKAEPFTCEVRRLCTDGTKNACSFLYAVARRAAFELGWTRIITYILESEPGTSLKAAGWRYVGPAGGGSWNRRSRRREDKAPTERKQLWEAVR